MATLDFLRRFLGEPGNVPEHKVSWTEAGISVDFTQRPRAQSADGLLEAVAKAGPEASVLGAYLAQLSEEQKCVVTETGAAITWQTVYDLLQSDEHRGAMQLFELPPIGSLRPMLSCENKLSDPDFELSITGWVYDQSEVTLRKNVGAIVQIAEQQQMLPYPAWKTRALIQEFQHRGTSDTYQDENELAWARIREYADQANAVFTHPYLETTYVLSPQTLRLPQVKEDTPFGRVFTVSPTFEGAPEGWLRAFDGYNSVQPDYELSNGRGRVRVIITEPVRKVLEVIKREMPGRRIAGAKAQRFMSNPWAFMGDSAHEVLREDEFQQDKAGAGPCAAVFNLVGRFAGGRVNGVELCITEHFADSAARTTSEPFQGIEQFAKFLGELKSALEQDKPQFPWQEFDLSIDGESAVQLESGQQLHHLWSTQPAERISFEDIYELAGFSSRIEGIGAAKPIYVPVFQKPAGTEDSESGWAPSDLMPMVRVTLQGHEGQVLVPLTPKWVADFDAQVKAAELSGAPEVKDAALPTPIPTGNARTLADSFKGMLGAQERIKPDGAGKVKEARGPRETLLMKLNFHRVDYVEERKKLLSVPKDSPCQLPNSIRNDGVLKPHQEVGIAWFQYLVSMAPTHCRGALLADDMGLGKTLQLLCVVGRYYEERPNAAPSVIFAPKSLLENWANEAKKFFTPSFPEVLVLYGDELRSRRQPLDLIDNELRTRGITELLKPNWAGNAKLIITTYETLTSLEFSFAKQPFAFVICDEAQRIKTPGTLVTLAAKKLKADFRVACTGTPVENTLADLWCLFDFVQPGLLGALEEFGKTYRRPIECDTDEQEAALVLLQRIIAPQTLRRTKADIASLLPNKLFATKKADDLAVSFKANLNEEDRLEIWMTEHQKYLYKAGLKKLRDAANESDGRKRARLSFGALHLMKAVCAEPYCLPSTKFIVDKAGKETHLANSPKLKWLLEQLQQVRQDNEKAIIFTELREAQAALYYFLRESFNIKPIVINGDSQGRQDSIDRFSSSPGFNVIILSTLSAGAGLNVTAANHVFHFTRAWNPAKESQATDRAFRIGQEKDVFVYCPTVVADFHTFEHRLDQLLKRKAGLAHSTLDDRGMTAMLNGSGADITFGELVGGEGDGEALPRRLLTMDDVDRMDGDSFESFCALLWTKRGFQAAVTKKRGGDGGIDVVAIKGRDGELLQCKSSKREDLGWDAIKEVVGGAAMYQARFAGTRMRKVAVTNQQFNGRAIEQASASQVELVTRTRLEELLGKHPISNHDMEDEILNSIAFTRETT